MTKVKINKIKPQAIASWCTCDVCGLRYKISDAIIIQSATLGNLHICDDCLKQIQNYKINAN